MKLMEKQRDMKTAVIYSRVSSATERQNTERQVADLTIYAEKNDYIVSKVFSEHISGVKKNEERIVLCECIEYCLSNNIDTLLLSELSRLGRSTLQVLKSLEVLHNHNVNVYIQNLGLNTLNPDRNINPIVSILITVMAEMASIERTGIVYRLNSGRANYIANGGKLGRKKGSIKTKEQKEIEYAKVISLLKKGYSVRNIAEITKKGVATVMRIKKEFAI